MLAADNWCVKVQDRIYGPYSSQQLRKFAHEGRFASTSLVAPAGSRNFREARAEPQFAAFFGLGSEPARAARNFGRRADEPPAAARHAPSGSKSEAADASVANFIIVFDVVTAAATRAETAILALGPAFRVGENVWTVQSDLTALGVRNAIAPHLTPRDSIFVIDATRGRASWSNFPPEVHAKLAAAWAQIRH